MTVGLSVLPFVDTMKTTQPTTNIQVKKDGPYLVLRSLDHTELDRECKRKGNPACRISVSPRFIQRFTGSMKMNSAQLRQQTKTALQSFEVFRNLTACEFAADRPQNRKKGTERVQTLLGSYVSMVGPEGFEPPTKRL